MSLLLWYIKEMAALIEVIAATATTLLQESPVEIS
jgi:hypothetical protein